jgi:hypothetical protein
MVERTLLGEGNEHRVWESRHNGVVLKTPRILNSLSVKLRGRQALEVIQSEIDFNKDKCNDAKIRFPETRVFSMNGSYVLLQQYIAEDGTLSDAEIRNKVSTDPYFLSIYDQRPQNFISNGGELYLVDLTFGFTRIFDGLGVISHEKQNILKGIFARGRKPARKEEVMEFEARV